MDKVTINPDAELGGRYPGSAPTRVEITTVDGLRFDREVGYAVGSHRRPMDDVRFEQKQRELLAFRLSGDEIDRWLEVIADLEHLDTLDELADLLRSTAPEQDS